MGMCARASIKQGQVQDQDHKENQGKRDTKSQTGKQVCDQSAYPDFLTDVAFCAWML